MLIANPTAEQWNELYERCLAAPEDIAHLNQYPYTNGRIRNGEQLVGFLQNSNGRFECWLISEAGRIVGFVNYGEVVPGQQNAFGLAIGRRFVSQGYGTRALRDLIDILSERGIQEVNGFCNRQNTPIIRAMQRVGFEQDPNYRDPIDLNVVRYVWQPPAPAVHDETAEDAPRLDERTRRAVLRFWGKRVADPRSRSFGDVVLGAVDALARFRVSNGPETLKRALIDEIAQRIRQGQRTGSHRRARQAQDSRKGLESERKEKSRMEKGAKNRRKQGRKSRRSNEKKNGR